MFNNSMKAPIVMLLVRIESISRMLGANVKV